MKDENKFKALIDTFERNIHDIIIANIKNDKEKTAFYMNELIKNNKDLVKMYMED